MRDSSRLFEGEMGRLEMNLARIGKRIFGISAGDQSIDRLTRLKRVYIFSYGFNETGAINTRCLVHSGINS